MLPNLIIIGAPKCGTTSLHFYLDQHPEISMSERKELRYFSRPDWRERREWYERQFEGFDTAVRGEASPRYTRYPDFPEVPLRAYSMVPEAKLIYLVRDPVDRTVSHWVQRVADGDRTPFEHYVGEWDRPDNPIVAASKYATQAERYLEFFPRSQLLVVDQHDLKVDREATLREIFGYLGVKDTFHSPRFDEERNTHSEKYALTSVGKPLWNRALGPAVRRLPTALEDPVRRHAIRRLSRPITAPSVIDPEFRPRLEALLKGEADRLRALTGQPFASWSV